ncbi:MAG: hypothetical protein CSA45_04880 [Gammaproteobacteria bacterium]|nr:MAG: hypothetical protein CSA45_04880 [Gammaproteobacteria bacterium]
MERYPEAITAYGEARQQVEESPDELVHFAEILYRQKGSQFADKAIDLPNQASTLDSSQYIDGLILHGTATSH